MYLGVAHAIQGVYFVMNMTVVENLVGGAIGQFQTLLAWYVLAVHTVGGIMLLLGLATRLVAALNMSVLFGALLFVHSPEGLFSPGRGFEFSLFVLFALGLVFWRGSGRLSFDYYLTHDKPLREALRET